MLSVLQKLIKERSDTHKDIEGQEKDYKTGKHLIWKSLVYLGILLVVAILMRFNSQIIAGLAKLFMAK
jgi:hypothetical protein